MGSRRVSRIIAFQTLFRYDFTGETLDELIDFSWLDKDKLEKLSEETLSFSTLIITGTITNLKEIDSMIAGHLEHWDFTRLSKVDRANLRISVYCLLYQDDIPPTVTIDEAIDIAKEFGSDDSYRFINGVLDSIFKDLGKMNRQ
jgi:transcription antitermination protein NusB